MPAAETTPWYAEGLRFECRGCGHCCRGPGGYVWVDADEIRALAAALGMELDAFGKKYLRRTNRGYALIDSAVGDCILLGGDGRCSVYEARPLQCRTYPWWPEVVASRRQWEEEKDNCPGVGCGRLHGAEHIAGELAKDK